MNKKRKCKRCSSFLSEFDPHTICKPCRQPDPQMFYCADNDCEACNVIKVYKDLDIMLRKQELENLARKLKSPVGVQKAKQENKVSKHKKTPSVSKKHQQTTGSKDSKKTSEPNPEIVATLMKGIHKDKTNVVKSFSKISSGTDISSPSTSANSKSDLENLKDLETRLFDRIMSSLKTSLSTDSTPNLPEQGIPKVHSSATTSSAKVKDVMQSSAKVKSGTPSSAKVKCGTPPSGKVKSGTPPSAKVKSFQKVVLHTSSSASSPENENDLQDSILSLFAEVLPDSLARNMKGSNDDGKDDYVFKISSRVSDILLKGTVLSSPSEAVKICDELNIEDELTFWPVNLNAADILHTSFATVPSMKLHPKVRHMHTMLFGKFNPSLPQELVSSNFTLSNVSFELKNECLFAREQLQRLLLMFSMVDYFRGVKIVQDGNTSVAKLFELLSNQLKVSMVKQANFVGFLIQEIRRDLLSDAYCKVPDAISKLIMGPVHLTQFFGPYVKELQEIIRKKGPAFCITSKSEKANINLMKLPAKFKDGDSVSIFLNSLRTFFESNSTNNKDKTAILESLLPKSFLERIANFVKPHKVCDKEFEDLALISEKLDENHCSNYLKERHNFTNARQHVDQSIKSYAESLETMLPCCMYSANAREILRDQFVFGLQDETLQQYLLTKFAWSFEDCVNYAIKQKQKENEKFLVISGTGRKSSEKRKNDAKEDIVSKKMKLEENTEANLYSTFSLLNCGSKNKMVKISNHQEWNDHFGFGVNYSFEVYCPWTGQVLRS